MAGGIGVRNARELGAFRAFRTFLRDGFEAMPGPHICVDVALSWATTRVRAVSVRMDPGRTASPAIRCGPCCGTP